MELRFKGRTYTESELKALEMDAYCNATLPVWQRLAYALTILAAGSSFSWMILTGQIKEGSLVPYGLIPIAGFMATLTCAIDAWMKREHRTYTRVSQSQNPALRKKHATRATLALVASLALIWTVQFLNQDFEQYWWAALPLAFLWLGYLAYTLTIFDTRPMTEAAAIIFARDAHDTPWAGWQISLVRFLAKLPVRYALGFVLYYACLDDFTSSKAQHLGWSGILMLGIPAILATHELAIPVLGLAFTVGLALVVFGLVSLLPPIVASIIITVIVVQTIRRTLKNQR